MNRRTAEHLVAAQVSGRTGLALFGIGLVLGAVVALAPVWAGRTAATAVLVLVLGWALFKIALPLWSLSHGSPAAGWRRLADAQLPRYTVMAVLYKEANMVPQMIGAIDRLTYPKDRLQALMVLEADDVATIAAVEAQDLPPYWQVVKVPASEHVVGGRPLRGKPRALNHAAQFVDGDFLVVYDAEDIPDPDQLRKAVEAFRFAGPGVACVQAVLNFNLNRRQSWVTRLMSAEYTWHFRFHLQGLDRLGLVIPLGGTSNHLRMRAVRAIAIGADAQPRGEAARGSIGIWDAFNVTEDCDLGGWLAAHGYRTVMIDSATEEEAPVTLVAAFNQRTRWVKGFAQTAMVFLRDPAQHVRELGAAGYLCFLLSSGGSYLTLLLTPFVWAYTIAWMVWQPSSTPGILGSAETAWVVFWIALASNVLLALQVVVAAVVDRQWATIGLVVLLPVWWLMLSLAAMQALRELVTGRAQFWNKTSHGNAGPEAIEQRTSSELTGTRATA